MKYVILIVSFFISVNLHAESYSNVSTIKGMTVGENYVRIQLESMKEAEGCASSSFYYLDITTNKDMYSALLAAKTSNQKLSLQLTGCEGNYPKIRHVYLCDKHFCS